MRTLLLAALLIACAPSAPPAELANVGKPAISQNLTLFHAANYTAPGDSLDYTITCTPIARATGYRWNTTTTGAGWTGMLTSVVTTGCTVPFKPINLTAWDSTSFTACVRGVRGTDSSKTAGCTTWKVVRGLGPMQPPTVDSSRIITALYVYPETATITLASIKQFCGYFGALDGRIRMVSGQENLPDCQLYYDQLPPSVRLPGYPTALQWLPRGAPASSQVIVDARGVPSWRDDPDRRVETLPIRGKPELARMIFASR